jgi:hypothetical protein
MCKDKQNNKETKSRLWIWIVVAIGVVLVLWGLNWWGISKFINEPSDQGIFGDMFGAVNALFSGLAFAGLIITLLYQREELKLQREELQETRKELKGQREEFEEQNKTMKRQRFENTFFNMLSLQQEIVANLSVEWKEREWNALESQWKERVINNKGREVFEKIYEGINVQPVYMHIGIKEIVNHEIENYNEYRELISRFDHYFRHLYRIFKYIDESDLIDEKERYEYASIVRSQLSDYELVMLFYNCLAQKDNGTEENNFKPLIEKYAIFNNLREGLLAKEDHYKLYKDGAYQYEKQI